MRVVSVSSLKGDEILGKQIFDESGRILLSVGVRLKPYYIEKIKELGIYSVYIDDDISKNLDIEESISDKTRQMSKHAVKKMIDGYCREGKTDNNSVMNSVNSVIEDILSNKDVLINVAEISASDNNIYSHSVNVCVLATIIGTHMGYSMSKLKDIAAGALLHDIGKITIMNDKKISSEFKDENEFNRYMELMHPKIGYDLLGDQHVWSAYVKVAVLMHHERNDGSGYPLQLKGDEINELAKIVSICDTFDNMISGREENERKTVYEAIEYLIGMSNIYFDEEIVKKFTMNIAAFPTGSGVILNSNEKGLVVKQNNSMPMRPVVKVLYDETGSLLSEPYEVDLLKELTLFITKTSEI
ncbi:c-di-GMP phosphodiesterase [Clostridium beijerinckii]|uniref:C-di-GMP phosphodiesterase n=3 Tax=Clostridium TaxID=1485 RepID=A0AAV3W4W7_9CLOT|nr:MULTISPECIES: HD domain-containing phosphohydrolase [Clostridium]AJG99580.1 phosphohydrolase [Clostridium beijerinckii]ALB46286.1 HD domain-containing protein [Clostridium beijerinckii NRRL B-598]AVK46652.1 phosphohydrolase [Clostridium sp. MF28]MBE6086880.1 HD domain-containing protein [Clostridium beijerinckii]NRZ27030.1 HD-GYP domain-containing protein (c-di-GMP phosphodiesterase class II) [Clostridium beijerinckii]